MIADEKRKSLGRIILVVLLIIPLLLLPEVISLLPQIGNSTSNVAPPQNLTPPPSSPGFNRTGVEVFYSDVLDAAASTLNATGTIVNYPVGSLPPQYQGMILSTNQIIQNLTSQLRTTGSQYEPAHLAEELGNYATSSTELALAQSDILQANSTLTSLKGAFNKMEQGGIPTSALQSGISLLQGRVSLLSSEISSETSLVEKIQSGKIASTNMTLTVNPSPVKIGQGITCFGSLLSKGSALANESVSIAYNGYNMGVARTDTQGRYVFGFFAPVNYTTATNVTATFAPGGQSYAPSISVVDVGVSFYTPRVIIASAPSSVVPGETYKLSGNISVTTSGGATLPAPEEAIRAYLLGQAFNLTYFGTSPNQTFSIQFVPQRSAPDGPNTLVFNSSGDQNYSPLRSSVTINVNREAIFVQTSYPAIVNPFQSFVVSGEVSYGSKGNSTPLSDGSVILNIGGKLIQENLSSEGTFSIGTKPSLIAMLGGDTFSISVIPGPASIDNYSSTHSFQGVLTNPSYSTVGLLVIFLGFAVVYYVLIRGLLHSKHLPKASFSRRKKTMRLNENKGES